MIKGYSTCPDCGAEVTTYFTDKALADHDKQIRNEAIEEFLSKILQFATYTETEEGWSGLTGETKKIEEIADRMKGEQNE